MTDLPLTGEFPTYSDNVSEAQYGQAGLLDVYYSPRRFATETVCAVVATGANISVLVAMRRAYAILAVGQNRTSRAYSVLFVNLIIANSLSCILSWLSNNSLFMFNRQLIDVLNTEPCLFFIYLMAALFVSTAFGIVSTLTMLGFSVVQYLAIRRVTCPSTSSVSRVGLFVVLAWTFSLLGGIAPFTVMLILARQQACGPSLRRLISRVFLYGVDACVAFLVIIYITIFVLCSLIYLRIRAVHRELVRYEQLASVHCERRAFGTIAMMLATLGADVGHARSVLCSVHDAACPLAQPACR